MGKNRKEKRREPDYIATRVRSEVLICDQFSSLFRRLLFDFERQYAIISG
jgi:hypothetical protein